MAGPRCFISYSWDSDEHKEWVRQLATELQRNGVATFLDQWDVTPGMDLTNYVETSIRESNFVLLICTPSFALKANTGRGGVGYEKGIVTGEIFQGAASPVKFVPLLRKGTVAESLPSYLKSRVYLDFTDDSSFLESLESLLRHIFQSPKYVRPPVGPRPTFETEIKSRVRPAQREFSISYFQELVEYAYSSNGLDMSTKEKAVEWAEAWMRRFSEGDFGLFKQVFDYAYSSNGLDMSTKTTAVAWAEGWIQQFRDRDFGLFKQLFDYAYSSNGLDMSTKKKAIEWAEAWILEFSRDDLEKFKQLVDYAYSSNGLDMSTKEKAVEWALKKLGKV